jgi:hypothetical protein
MQRVVVEIEHAVRLVGHHQGALTHRVLGRYAGRAATGVASLRLDAAARYGPQKATIGLDVTEWKGRQ